MCVLLPGHTCWRTLWDCVPQNTNLWERSYSAGSTDKQVLLNLVTTRRHSRPSHVRITPCAKEFYCWWNTHDWARRRVRVLRRAASWREASDWTGTISRLELCRGNKWTNLKIWLKMIRIVTYWNDGSSCNTHIKVVADLGPTCGGLPCRENWWRFNLSCK